MVNITEKLHGTSARFGFVGGEYKIGTKRTEIPLPAHGYSGKCVWSQVWLAHGMQEALAMVYSWLNEDVVIYGEIVGKGVQSLHYGHTQDGPAGKGFYVYDISVGGRYLAPLEREQVCWDLGLGEVPLIADRVPWHPDLLELAEGETFIGRAYTHHIREGIVIEPCIPRGLPEIGRVKVKVLGNGYLEMVGKKRVTDIDLG
jgi:hypothetical protein